MENIAMYPIARRPIGPTQRSGVRHRAAHALTDRAAAIAMMAMKMATNA